MIFFFLYLDHQAHGPWHNNVLQLQAGVRPVAEKTSKHFQSFPHSWKVLKGKGEEKEKRISFGFDKHPPYLHLSRQRWLAKESAKNIINQGGAGGYVRGRRRENF